jgi:hypothetical protein
MTKRQLAHLIQQECRFTQEQKGAQEMKRWIWAMGGICAAAAGLLVWRSRRALRVEDFAQELDDAWADDQTFI